MENIARGKAECCICHKTLIKSCIIYTKWQCIKCFTLTKVLTKYVQFFGHFNTFMNKTMAFFDKNVSIV